MDLSLGKPKPDARISFLPHLAKDENKRGHPERGTLSATERKVHNAQKRFILGAHLAFIVSSNRQFTREEEGGERERGRTRTSARASFPPSSAPFIRVCIFPYAVGGGAHPFGRTICHRSISRHHIHVHADSSVPTSLPSRSSTTPLCPVANRGSLIARAIFNVTFIIHKNVE